jgi:hypothetical protein
MARAKRQSIEVTPGKKGVGHAIKKAKSNAKKPKTQLHGSKSGSGTKKTLAKMFSPPSGKDVKEGGKR